MVRKDLGFAVENLMVGIACIADKALKARVIEITVAINPDSHLLIAVVSK